MFKVKSLLSLEEKPPKKTRSKIHSDQRDYLLAENTHRDWKYLSVKERCQHFHRQFPEIRISPSTLRRVYARGDVKCKKCLSKYPLTESKKESIKEEQLKAIRQSLSALEDGKLLLYIDETNFQPYKCSLYSYAKKN